MATLVTALRLLFQGHDADLLPRFRSVLPAHEQALFDETMARFTVLTPSLSRTGTAGTPFAQATTAPSLLRRPVSGPDVAHKRELDRSGADRKKQRVSYEYAGHHTVSITRTASGTALGPMSTASAADAGGDGAVPMKTEPDDDDPVLVPALAAPVLKRASSATMAVPPPMKRTASAGPCCCPRVLF